MSHYRKIIVEGREYDRVSGRTVTKVRDRETGKSTLYWHEEWASPFLTPSWRYYGDDRWEGRPITYYADPKRRWVVKPAEVAGMIKGERFWKDHPCKSHPEITITGYASSPFDAEIYDRTTLIDNCPLCMHEDWLNT